MGIIESSSFLDKGSQFRLRGQDSKNFLTSLSEVSSMRTARGSRVMSNNVNCELAFWLGVMSGKHKHGTDVYIQVALNEKRNNGAKTVFSVRFDWYLKIM